MTTNAPPSVVGPPLAGVPSRVSSPPRDGTPADSTGSPQASSGPTRPSEFRFTLDGDAALEHHLARTCEKIAAGIRGIVGERRLEGLLLGGGYGRGEGGVLRTESGDRPYNDLEFYVFLRGNRHANELRFARALHVLGEILTPQAGIEVEFKIASLRELAACPVSMFSYDLALGHRWIVGSDELLAACAHHFEAERIPLSEATRLLMNRCSGLLFARERLQKTEFTAADADFVRRNIAKAELALGDALLVARREYHWSVRERHRRLEQLMRTEMMPSLPEVHRHHAAGLEFKLHPERSTAPRATLAAQHAIVTDRSREIWFWTEERRLHAKFASPRDYVESAFDKWPEATRLRNALVNWRVLGWRRSRGRAGRHPRERILHALTLLLWEPDAVASPDGLRLLQRELQTTAASFPELMCAYRALWTRVN